MVRANGASDAGEGEVDMFVREGGLVSAGFDGLAAGFDLRFDVGAEFVETGTNGALEVGCERV